MRLIDADDLAAVLKAMVNACDIELRRCVSNPYETYHHELLRNQIADILQGVLDYESPWIPCSKRLPEQQQKVLIQDFGEITIGYLNTENKWRDLTNLDDYLEGVEAWMPLPDPWKKGEIDGNRKRN